MTKHRVEEVILSLGRLPQKKVLQVISQLEELPVQIKIEPDLYGAWKELPLDDLVGTAENRFEYDQRGG